MKRLKYYFFTLLAASGFIFAGCNDFLDREPDTIITDKMVFSDSKLLQSVLANLYRRTLDWDRMIDDNDGGGWTLPDEVAQAGQDTRLNIEYTLFHWWNSDNEFDNYEYIRSCNLFLQGLAETTVLSPEQKLPIEAEVRALRAWCYFILARAYGGVPLIGDEVFYFEQGLSPEQIAEKYGRPRATEEATYDYICSEALYAYQYLPATKYPVAGRLNRFGAMAIRARAAVYAGSIAQHTETIQGIAPSNIRTAGWEAGIRPERASHFYQIALESAATVIRDGGYTLKDGATPEAKARAFYEACSVLTNNTEAIWALNRSGSFKTGFTQNNVPFSHAEDLDAARYGPLLNLVEEFEYIDGRGGRPTFPGDVLGELAINDASGNPIVYDNTLDIFAGKDPRLSGTIILPGANYKQGSKEGPVVSFAGAYRTDLTGENRWFSGTGRRDLVLDLGDGRQTPIISKNGPFLNSTNANENKTGFHIRKFMDEGAGASSRGLQSTMWNLRFRLSEMYLIAAEALVGDPSLTITNPPVGLTTAADYINVVRRRAGITELSTVTFGDIVQEYRAEMTFESQTRYYGLRRWRLAHILWNGMESTRTSLATALLAYRVYVPHGGGDDGKFVFRKLRSWNFRNPRKFDPQGYYVPIDFNWISRNPKLVKNPYQ